MHNVYKRKNLELAWQRVKRNRGSAGIDGQTLEETDLPDVTERNVMLDSFLKSSSQSCGRSIRTFTFFVLLDLYLWLEVDLRLIYHGGGMINNFPPFYRGWAFFQKFLSYPGGPVAYLSAFLSQLWYYSWAGALVVTLQAWLICLCIDVIIKAIHAPRLRWIRFIPPILLLVLYNQYTYRFVTTMALLASLVFICLYLTISAKSTRFRFAAFLALSVVLYYLAGGAYLVFAAFGVIYELFFQRSWLTVFFYFCSALAIPWAGGVLIFNVPIFDAFTELSPLSWKASYYGSQPKMLILVHLFYLLPLLIALGCGLWRLFFRQPPLAVDHLHSTQAQSGNGRKKGKNKPSGRLSKPGSGILSLSSVNKKLRWVIESLALFTAAGVVIFFSHREDLKILYEVDYYAYHKKWPQLLETARHCTTNNFFVIHAVNRALYHTNRLGCDMLSYPQHPRALFLTGVKQESSCWYRFDTHLDLGLINAAEYSLTKALEMFGERPILLKRLALVNMVKGNIGTARVYLEALARTLFDANWARMYPDRLESDPNLTTDQEIQRLRQLMLQKDFDLHSPDYHDLLLTLLEQNPKNSMAFGYLMASYLMAKRNDLLVQNLYRLDDFGYSEVPRLYEEAVIVYSITTRKAPGYQISPKSLRRWEGFRQILTRYGGDVKAALNDLKEEYGATYFFYSLYGFTGSEK